jgi:hypothetical protein
VRGRNSTDHFQCSCKCPVEKSRQPQGLSTAHMAQCLVNDVAKGMDIWYCIDEIMFSRAHEETDPVSALPHIFAIARIPAGDLGETCDRATDSAGFVATGIQGLADVIDMHFATRFSDESASDNPFVDVGFVAETSSDIDFSIRGILPLKLRRRQRANRLSIAKNASPQNSFRLGRC